MKRPQESVTIEKKTSQLSSGQSRKCETTKNRFNEGCSKKRLCAYFIVSRKSHFKVCFSHEKSDC